jgi:hypothetical protein
MLVRTAVRGETRHVGLEPADGLVELPSHGWERNRRR